MHNPDITVEPSEDKDPSNLAMQSTQQPYEGIGEERVTKATYIFVLCAALNSCNLGYDIGVSTEAGKLIQEEWDLTIAQRQIFVGSINFWASTSPM
jgi:hypothetical protein